MASIKRAFSPVIPIAFLYIIDSYTSLRDKIRNFREALTEVVERFYLKREHVQKPYKIYSKLIAKIHEHLKRDIIEDIYCFTVAKSEGKESLVLMNGSKFVWSYHFMDETFIDTIRREKVVENKGFSIESVERPFNLAIYSVVESIEFVYLFVCKSRIPRYYTLIGFFRTLEPSIIRMSRVLLGELRIQDVRIKELQKMSEKSQYVTRANKTMHFIRNRLGPFSNLLLMLNRFDSISNEKQAEFRRLLGEETGRANTELKNITERANDMLEKSRNPFVFNTTESIRIERVFLLLRENYNYFFPEKVIDVALDRSVLNVTFDLNIQGFELVLTDWLNNIKKYMKEFVSCKFLFENDELAIVFENDFTGTEEGVKKLIHDLRSSDRNEIMKRTTYGLFIIKSTLEEMNINYSVELLDDSKRIQFRLMLKAKKI